MLASISRLRAIASERAPTIASVIQRSACAVGVPFTARNAPTYASRSDLLSLVGHDAPLDVVAVPAQQLLERVAALVLPRPGDDTVRDGEHRGLQPTFSFVFSTSATSTIRMPLSTAFAMS